MGAPLTYLAPSDRREIIAAILKGEGAEAFARFEVSDLDQAVLVRAADKTLRAAAARTNPVRRYYKARIRAPLRLGYVLAGCVVIGCMSCATWIYYHVRFGNPTDYPLIAASVALVGFVAATLGWAVSSWTSHRNARAQHTINVLASRYSNTLYSDAAAKFNDAFGDRPITAEVIRRLTYSNDDSDRDALQSLRYLLNWFEFISAGVLLGDLDIIIVERVVRSNLNLYCDQCLPYIVHMQSKRPSTLAHLVELRNHFRDL